MGKRIHDVPGKPGTSLFDAICEFDNIRRAHAYASRGKRHYEEVQMVNSNPDIYLKKIQTSLQNHTFTTSPYKIERRFDGIKWRTIYILPYYPDRIVQWAILNVIGSILESKMISTTFSSIKGRGPYQCAQRVKYDLQKDPDGTFYCMKLDIRKFYPSINHEYLKGLYTLVFKDPELLWLLFDIIDSTDECEGIPIGNFLSQYSGNFFLTPFDHWIKEKSGINYYYRYMDDMLFLHESKKFLHELLNKIKIKLNEIDLTLKSNYQIFPVDDRGIDFVGCVLYHNKTFIRRRIANGYRVHVAKLLNKYPSEITEQDIQTYFSRKGVIIHGDTRTLQEKYGDVLESLMYK